MDWLSETCNNERLTMVHINTKAQTADILTKHFTKSDQWIALCQLMNIRPPLCRRNPAQAAPKRAPAAICLRGHCSPSMLPQPPQREVPPPPPPPHASQNDPVWWQGAVGDHARVASVSWEQVPLGKYLRASLGPQALGDTIRTLFF